MLNKYLRCAAVLVLTLVSLGAMAAADQQPLKIGFNGEPGNQIVVTTAKHVLENLGYEAKIVNASNGVQWQGVASGDLTAMLVAWLPVTQAAYWKRFKDKVVDLGVMFNGKIGWVVPDYIPKDRLDSIADLRDADVRRKVGARIVGIEPGAGIMARSEIALDTYDLNQYRLSSSSTPAMVAALKRAYDQKKWIVITGWDPLYIFARWNLRYLKDPQKVFGDKEQIHAIGTPGIREHTPRAATFLENYKIPVSLLEQALLKLSSSEGSIDKTVSWIIDAHPDLVKKWTDKAKQLPRYAK